MRKLFAVVLLVLSCLPSVTAAAAGPPARPQTERERRVARALAIVDDALASVSSLRLAQNRVRLRLAVSEALWTYDRDRAKHVVDDAVGDLLTLAANPDDTGWREGRNARARASSLRQQLIYSLLQRDPELALDVLLKTRAAFASETASRNGYDAERELEMQITAMVSAASPARALDLAEKSLSHGLSYTLSSVIQQARTGDPDGAARLSGEVYDKLKSAQPLKDQVAASLALFFISDALQDPESRGGAKPLLGASETRALEDLLFNAVLTARSTGSNTEELSLAINLANLLGSVLDQLAQRSPGVAAALRKKSDELNAAYARLSGGSQGRNYAPPENASPDEIVEAAESQPEGIRENYIYTAAEKVRAAGDADRARSIIESHVADPNLRRQYVDNIDRSTFYSALTTGHADEARALLSKFAQPSERVQYLVQIAQMNGLAERSPQSLALLAEADAIAGERAVDSGMFGARLLLAQTYAPVDPGRSFTILETSVDQLNVLLDAAETMDGFNCERQFEDGELLMFDGGSLTALTTQLTQALGTVAPTDVERAASAAGRFSRPESRSIALLTVAKVMFDTPAETPSDTPVSVSVGQSPER